MAKKSKSEKKAKVIPADEKAQDINVFYVGIKDPIEIRRSILESSKEIIQYLQRAEKFKAVRAEKAENVAKLRVMMADIAKLVNRLKSGLPKSGLRGKFHHHEEGMMKAALTAELEEAKEEMVAKKKAASEDTARPKPRPKARGELEKLEDELNAIENRLTQYS